VDSKGATIKALMGVSGLQMAGLRPVQEQDGFSTDVEETTLT
jgi:hypothetical protein